MFVNQDAKLCGFPGAGQPAGDGGKVEAQEKEKRVSYRSSMIPLNARRFVLRFRR